MERWKELIIGGAVIIVATIAPDKGVGLSIGLVLILLGICVSISGHTETEEI